MQRRRSAGTAWGYRRRDSAPRLPHDDTADTAIVRRRRAVRYFYDHTVLAGQPLAFTAPICKRVFGFIALLGLYLAFEIASRAGQVVAVAEMIAGAAALAPFGWAAAMRFRLGSTRWRRLNFRFDASYEEIDAAS